jgi:hypothetical protein
MLNKGFFHEFLIDYESYTNIYFLKKSRVQLGVKTIKFPIYELLLCG